MFLCNYEKQLDGKRRILVPREFRDAAAGSFDGIFCFPSIEADCVEGGGQAMFDRYAAVVDELPFGDPLRTALETSVFGDMHRLAYDTAGRITLPEGLCDMFGFTDWVILVGLRERFQIWPRDTFLARHTAQRLVAREGYPAHRTQQRAPGPAPKP